MPISAIDNPSQTPGEADDPGRLAQLALDAAGIGVWTLDLATGAMHGSPALHRLLDRDAPPAPWTLADIESSLLPADLDLFRDAFARALREGELRCVVRMPRRDGRCGWLALMGRVTPAAGGGPGRLAGILQDVSACKDSGRPPEAGSGQPEADSSLRVEIAERRLAEDLVRELLGRQVEAVEEERRRIARELHDSLGQHLAALAIGLRAIADDASCPKPIAERVGKVRRTLRDAEEELDRLSYELRPLALDDLGLDDALRSLVKHWSDESGVALELHTYGLRTGRLNAWVETTVYRVVQEALTNAHKHAGATRVGIIVERRLNELRVVVEDDGRGFDTERVVPQEGRHVGLRGMAERARLVGGTLEVESTVGGGTTIYLAIPVREEEAAPP